MTLTEDVRQYALGLGFAAAGVAEATPLLAHERVLRRRLADGLLAGIAYLTPERAGRAVRPQALLPGARAVLSLAIPYAGGERALPPRGGCGLVAAYARGRDYHLAARERLARLAEFIARLFPGASCRAFVDATPLLERAFAVQAGLGWFGKNNCLVTPGRGSWVLLAEIVTDAPLRPDAPAGGDCGTCTACLEACPTGALEAPYTHRASRCLSYVTTELRGPIPLALRPLLAQRVLGCDSCQEACPRNAGVRGGWAELQPTAGLATWLDLGALFALSPAAFADAYGGSAAVRAKRRGLLRNAAVALGNAGDRGAVTALLRGLADEEPLVRGHAAWALGRLGGRRARAGLERAQRGEEDAYVRGEIIAALAAA